MKCTVCKHGSTSPGVITATLERDNATIVIKGVPAEICENCGEEYLSAATSSQILKHAEDDINAGIQLDIRKYKAAA